MTPFLLPNGNAVPGIKPDAHAINTTKGKVDVTEVQSPSQDKAFMNAKVEKIKDALGDQAGEVKWIPPKKGAVRLPDEIPPTN